MIRKQPGKQAARITVDAGRLVNEGRPELDVPLEPGDVVLVPYAQVFRVYVSGAVERQGPVEFSSSDGITILQAITAAGGATERGNLGKVTVLRKQPSGPKLRIAVNVKKIRKGKADDMLLERGDIVLVGEWLL